MLPTLIQIKTLLAVRGAMTITGLLPVSVNQILKWAFKQMCGS